MTTLITEDTEAYLRAFSPAASETVREIEAYGETHGPSTVGRELGRLLGLLSKMVGASRVFEVGSGYGYSAYWFAEALPPDGEVILTDMDQDRLDRAEAFLTAAGLNHKATYEVGDAIDTLERVEGQFDVVLVDVSKTLYPAALDAARDKVLDGGLLLADNAMVSTSVQFDALVELLAGGDPDGVNESTMGVATYLDGVRSDPAFETMVVPLGEGLAVSYKTGTR